MNDLQEFNFNGSSVRVQLDEQGEPWFVAKDVAEILDYRMASDMTRRLDDDEKGTQKVRTPYGEQEMTIINESGLYNAILGSTKPEAKAFKRWVTHEVLPQIRKTGCYAPAAPDLLQSTIRMLDALNRRIEAGENVPPHILKYAWNMALCTKTRALPLSEDMEIRQVFSAFTPGERIAKSEVYRAYCEKCSGRLLSPRAFWPQARRCVNMTETRNGTGRFIIINL